MPLVGTRLRLNTYLQLDPGSWPALGLISRLIILTPLNYHQLILGGSGLSFTDTEEVECGYNVTRTSCKQYNYNTSSAVDSVISILYTLYIIRMKIDLKFHNIKMAFIALKLLDVREPTVIILA